MTNPDWNSTKACNVAGALADQAARQPDAVAIHYPTDLSSGQVNYRSCSYNDLNQASNAYARGLDAWGIGRGTRVALMVPPGLEFFSLFFALFKAGCIPVLIDPGIGLKPLKTCLAEAAPEAFIGIGRAQLARMLLRWAPQTIRKTVTVGRRWLPGGISTRKLAALGGGEQDNVLADTRPDDMAAILFTSGSTGIPKGVIYRHRNFTSQVDLLRNTFDIRPGETDLPTFPPFALFDPALGMTTVLPWMDPTRPAKADPRLLVNAIERFEVTNVFGSPALLKVLSKYTSENDLQLPSIKRVISAGAAVPISTLRSMQAALTDGAAVHTPYGATECLPVASISSLEIDSDMEAATATGAGICVGRPVAPNEVRIISITDEAIPSLDEVEMLAEGQRGEVIVTGPTCTDAYWKRDAQTHLAKMIDEQGRTWHRMGDIGWLDEQGRLWFCGRKSQRVRCEGTTLFPDQVEAVFNAAEGVQRSALVGVGEAGHQRAVICIEAEENTDQDELRTQLLDLAKSMPELQAVKTVLFHSGFPVDIRHNAKIGREELSVWAAGELQ